MQAAADFLFHDKTAGNRTWYDLCHLNTHKYCATGNKKNNISKFALS